MYVYSVRNVLEISPDDTSALMAHQDMPWVTLMTCRGYNSATDTYQYRVLVRAVLTDEK